MKSIIRFLGLCLCALSLSAFAAGGGIETVTTTAAADAGESVTASTVRLSGFLEGVTFKCGSTTGTATIATVPMDTAVPGCTLITTNITGDITVFPRVNGEKPFIYGESLLLTVSVMSVSNATMQATYKLSK